METAEITILCENRTCITQGVAGEHGFSALIEQGAEKILLDTGQGLTLLNNAKTLDIALDDLTKLVISHGHYDHTGGLPALPRQKDTLSIFAHPDIFTPKYSVTRTDSGNTYKYIGISLTQEEIESRLNSRFVLTSSFMPVTPSIFFSGQVPRTTDFEKEDARLLLKSDNVYIQDHLYDDASLLIKTPSGPVILTGCAHSGIVNVMEHFSEKTGHKEFHAVIGGTHLGFLNSARQLTETMNAFDRFKVQLIAVSHCTGNEAAAACYNRFKDRFAFANAGWTARF